MPLAPPLAEESLAGGWNLPWRGLLSMQALEVGSGLCRELQVPGYPAGRLEGRSWGPDSRWMKPMAPGFLTYREDQSRASRTEAKRRGSLLSGAVQCLNGIVNTPRKEELVVKFLGWKWSLIACTFLNICVYFKLLKDKGIISFGLESLRKNNGFRESMLIKYLLNEWMTRGSVGMWLRIWILEPNSLSLGLDSATYN